MGISKGFNAGFAKGLAGVLGQKRQQDLELEKETRGRQDKLTGVLLETMLQRAERPEDVVALLGKIDPSFKNKDFSSLFQSGIAPLYQGMVYQGQGGASAGAAGSAVPPAGPAPPTPLGPGGAPPVGAIGTLAPGGQAAGTPPPAAPRSGFRTLSEMGVDRAVAPLLAQTDERVTAGRQAVIDRLAARGTPLDEQETQYFLANGQLARPYGSSAGGTGSLQYIEGVDGDAIFDKNPQSPTYGKLIDPITRQPLTQFDKARPNSAGTWVNNALASLGYASLDAARAAGAMDQVNAKAEELRRAASYATGTGTARAGYEKPADIPTAMATGVDVGTTAPQLAGQRVLPQATRERAQGLESIKADLQRVLGDGTPGSGLLAVLPSKDEWSGKVPGATLAFRRRNNEYREQIAALESVVDSMVNVLARTRGEQRGTQTEKDAERAYNAVVNLQAGLRDPLGGDTRESAAVRIREALDGIDRVIAIMPKQGTPTGAPAPTATPKATAAPAGTKPKVTNAAPAAQKVGNAWVIP